MNKFINRIQELKTLQQLYASSGKGELVVIYGRRRLGKTALIKEFIRGKPSAYYMADRAAEKAQMEAFALAISESISEPTLSSASYSSWYDLFAAFDRVRRKEERFILVIDEYQYLCQTQPAFSSFLQKWWDEHWQNQNLLLIICGSLTSMMFKETLSSSAPLYGRASATILLRPMPFRHMNEFFSKRHDFSSLVEFYSISGGVPRYINLAAKHSNYLEALENLVLKPEGVLYSEAKNILRDEISVPNVCWSILNAIASGATRISELGAKLCLPANQLTRYIDLLKELQLVRRIVPVLESNPQKSKKGIYKVCDPFFRLWFGTIYPYESFLEIGNKSLVLKRIKKRLAGHLAECYEDICAENILGDAEQFQYLKIGRQWGANYEIDLSGVNEDGRLVFVGECKWSNHKVGISLLKELQNKISENSLPVSENCRFIFFSKSGFTDDLIKLSREDKTIVLGHL
jgi:AAA+ ATPase superfamily predicted ATPase